MKIFLYLSLCCLVLVSCSQDPLDGDHWPEYSILFVGNSLTYANDLPSLVREEGSKKEIRIQTEMLANGNYAIIDHWEDGYVQVEIASGRFDYVIIQQGPSSMPEGRNMLIDDGKKYADLCREHGAKLCYFMVWPDQAYYHTFDNVIKNHRDAANLNDAILIPVGEVWKEHFENTNSYDYYSSDGFHPSLKGSKAAARVIVATLF